MDSNYTKFLNEEVLSNKDLWLQRNDINVSEKRVNLFFNGDVTEATETDLRNELKKYDNLEEYELVINENKARSVDRIVDAYDRAISDLERKDNIIQGLQKEIEGLQENISQLTTRIETNAHRLDKNSIPFSTIAKDAKIRYNEIKQISFSKVLATKDFIKIDTIPEACVSWNGNIKEEYIIKKEIELRAWLQKELKLDTLYLKRQ